MDRLTLEEQFALRSELGELIRIARIARPDALYGASVSAQAFGSVGESVINPNDFDAISVVNLTKDIRNITHNRIPCFDEFMMKFTNSVNRAYLINQIKRSGNRKLMIKYRI